MPPVPLRVGPYEIRAAVTSRFGLDGGAMFGSVPRPLWARESAPDEGGRVALVARTLVIRGEGRTVLVDTGIGSRFPEKAREHFAIDPGVEIVSALRGIGVEPSDVTHVLLTHLHFDHAGGLFRGGIDRPEPVFPGAKILVQEANWERARRPGPKETASYRPEEIEPLSRCDLVLLGDEAEPLPGIRVRASDGHTRGHQTVEVFDGDRFLIYTGDLVPTVSHLRLAFSMGYDQWAERVIEDKERLMDDCLRRDGILVFDHDPRVSACRLGRNDKGFFIREKIDL